MAASPRDLGRKAKLTTPDHLMRCCLRWPLLFRDKKLKAEEALFFF